MATTQAPTADPYVAVEQLRAALDAVDIVLPSLAVDDASTWAKLVILGSVRADVAMKLAEALRGRRDGGDVDE